MPHYWPSFISLLWWGFYQFDGDVEGKRAVLIRIAVVEPNSNDHQVVVTSGAASKFFSDEDYAIFLDEKYALT
jgi:hypothetical protein